MIRSCLLLLTLVLVSPGALSHKPPGPITTCQPFSGEAYHDYVVNWGGLFASPVGDGNLEDCGSNTMVFGPALDDNGSLCQMLKMDPSLETLHQTLCLALDTNIDEPFRTYDGEYDFAMGGAFLAVNSGDGAYWGSEVCYGIAGHHSQNVYAEDWPSGTGPAFTVTGDYSRTPPPPGSKGPRPDCGDGLVEPCDPTPPSPSSQPFPGNVVVDTTNGLLWSTFGPSGSGTTCNVNDCVERNPPPHPPNGVRSNPFGPTHLVTTCAPGIDGMLVVFIETDFDAPHVPFGGHVWTY